MDLKYFSIIILCTICAIRNSYGARILAVFPLPASSHFAMFQRLLLDLADRGHQLDIISQFYLKQPHPNCRYILNLAGQGEVMVNTMTIKFVEEMGSGNIEEYAVRIVGNRLCHLLGNPEIEELIKNPPNDPPYDLVITELFFANCFFAFGKHLKVPTVAMTSGPTLHYSNEPLGNPLNTAIVPEYSGGSIIYMNFWQRLINTIYTWKITYRIRQLGEMQNDVIKKYFGPEMPSIRELERNVSLLLVNSHHTLNGVRPMTPAIVEVGGIHIDEDVIELPVELKEWMDHSTDGFIYVSFGSLFQIESMPKTILSEMFEGFAKIAPLRVLMKSTSPEKLPPGIPDNVITLEWVPQQEILKHRNVRGFVTHGGLGGVQEATVYGIPFVGIPIYADQPRNVKNCAERGAAVYLDYREITADTLAEAINAIVYDPKYKQNMIALSKRFLDRPISPRHEAVYWVEYILNHGGDSLRSPAVKLTWWQLALLDVYGSIVVAVLVLIYLIKLFISALIRRVLRKTVTPLSKKTKLN